MGIIAPKPAERSEGVAERSGAGLGAAATPTRATGSRLARGSTGQSQLQAAQHFVGRAPIQALTRPQVDPPLRRPHLRGAHIVQTQTLRKILPREAVEIFVCTPLPRTVRVGKIDFRAELSRDTRTLDRKSTRLNSSHIQKSRMPSSA